MSDGLDADDYVFRGAVPDSLPGPIRRWLRDLTYAEWHMVILGLIGLPLGSAWTTGTPLVRAIIALIGAILTVAAFFRLCEMGPTGRLLSRETWYFAGPFVLFLTLGWLIVTLIL